MKDTALRKFISVMMSVVMVFSFSFPVQALADTGAGGTQSGGFSAGQVDLQALSEGGGGGESAAKFMLSAQEEEQVPVSTYDGVISTETISAGNYAIAKDGTYKIGDFEGTVAISIAQNLDVVIEGKGATAGKISGISMKVGNGSTLTIRDYYANQGTDNSAIDFLGNGTLKIEGANLIDNDGGLNAAVVHVAPDKEVHFNGTGTLYGYKSALCSYIGGNVNEANGKIVIDGGYWFLKGTKTGSIIGGDSTTAKGGDIIVNGGELYLKGVARGALIGGSNQGKSGDVIVNGGLVELFEDFSGPAIGAGSDANAGSLTVNGGSLKTTLSSNSANSYGAAADFGGMPGVSWKAVKATNASDYALLAFDVSDYIEDMSNDTVTVYLDNGTTPFYSGRVYTYVTNEVKNPTANDDFAFDTMANWLTNDAKWLVTEEDYGTSAYPSKNGSSLVPEKNLYFALSKANHTLKVGDDIYNFTWDAEAGEFVQKMSYALKDGSTLNLTSTDEGVWDVTATDDRTYLGSDDDQAQIATTITTDKAGWLIFDWQFATSGNWKDVFKYTSTGDTTSGNYETIGANSSSYVGKWTTKVEAINAGTTNATWTYTKGDGSTACIDEIRFVDMQTPVAAVADDNTTVTVKKSGSEVTAVDPGSYVTFTAAAKDGYVFAGWKTSTDDEEYFSTDQSVSVTVYDDAVTYYAYSDKIGFEGSGTEKDPYLITSLADLNTLAGYVNAGTSFADTYFKLANDIDADGAAFAGIGKSSFGGAFSGTFDGDGKAISNIKLANGLFNYASNATIKNLSIEDATLAFDKTLMNSAGIVAASFTGTMTGVTTSGTVTTATDFSYSSPALGGLVGNLGSNSTISDCSSSAVITPTKSYGGNTDPNVGGIVGAATSYGSTIANCAFTGEINGTSSESNVSCVGGIVGKISSSTTVSGCVVAADISGYQRIGGIVGSMEASGGDISNCEYSGNVSGTNYVGGIAGYMNASNTTGIQNCLASGTVTATGNNAGGISGYSYRAGLTSGNIALSLSVRSAGGTAGRITGGTEESTWSGAPTLSNNYAWADMTVNGAVVADDAATAVATGVDGVSVLTSTLLGTETYDPAKAWSTDSWTVAAGAKPQLKTSDDIAAISTNKYPGYIYAPWYTSVTDGKYVISTAAELMQFAEIVNGTSAESYGIAQDDFADATVTLANDIDLAGLDFTPIGNKNAAFAGTFDGAGKSIENMSVSGQPTGWIGLFGHTANTAVVKDFTISGSVTSTIGSHSTDTDNDFVGGVVGRNKGAISGVYSSVVVTANSLYNVGGIAGFNDGGRSYFNEGSSSKTALFTDGAGTINGCLVTGNVTGQQAVGGIAGASSGNIDSCVVTSKVDGVNASSKNGVGGIVGRDNNDASFYCYTTSNCLFAGTVGRSGQKWTGGIKGFENGTYSASKGSDGYYYRTVNGQYVRVGSNVINSYMVGTLVSGAGYNNAIIGNYEGYYDANNYRLNTITNNTGNSEGEIGIAKSADDFTSGTFSTGYLNGEGRGWVEYSAGNDAVKAAMTAAGFENYPVPRAFAANDTSVPTTITDNGKEPVASYVNGQTFNVGDYKLQVNYSDNTREIVDDYTLTLGDEVISDAYEFATADNGKTLTISYAAGDATYSKAIVLSVVAEVPTSITVSNGKPTQFTFAVGQVIAPANMVASVKFTNGKTETIAYYDDTNLVFTLADEENTTVMARDYALTAADSGKTLAAQYARNGETVTAAALGALTVVPAVTVENGVYQLSNSTDMLWFAAQQNDATRGTLDAETGKVVRDVLNAKLTADIDLSEVAWTPIGGNSASATAYAGVSKYNGTFDGDGHTVTFAIDGGNYRGLFAYTDGATIQNVTTDGTMSTTGYTGGIVANAANTAIVDCANKATITSTGIYSGGIVGTSSGTTTISDCTNTGAITGANYTGGIVGNGVYALDECLNSAAISPQGTSARQYIGGLAGSASNGSSIANSANTGAVTGSHTVGGIVGGNLGANISCCYNTGAVTATAGSASQGVGGIAGLMQSSAKTISNSYNVGTVTGENGTIKVGAIIGYLNIGATLSDVCFLESNATDAVGGLGSRGVVTGEAASMTGDELKASAAVIALNQNLGSDAYNKDIASEPINGGYPVLTWQGGVTTKYEWYTSVDPEASRDYVVSTPSEMEGFAEIVNGTVPESFGIAQDDFADATVTLDKDIDLSAFENWTAIGTKTAAFAGTFDGDDNAITGLTIANGKGGYKGLFANNAGTVENLSVDGSMGSVETTTVTTVDEETGASTTSEVDKYTYVGGGDYYGVVAYNTGTVSNVVSTLAIYPGAGNTYSVGGVVGCNDGGMVSECGFEGVIASDTSQSTYRVGGVVGYQKSEGTISECYNTAYVEAWNYRNGNQGVGGILGSMEGGLVSDCFSVGDVFNGYGDTATGGKQGTGGIVGAIGAGSVDHCYAIGEVHAPGSAGVVIGKVGNGEYTYLFSQYDARAYQQYGSKTDTENTWGGKYTNVKYSDGSDENADGSLKFGGAAIANSYNSGYTISESYTMEAVDMATADFAATLSVTGTTTWVVPVETDQIYTALLAAGYEGYPVPQCFSTAEPDAVAMAKAYMNEAKKANEEAKAAQEAAEAAKEAAEAAQEAAAADKAAAEQAKADAEEAATTAAEEKAAAEQAKADAEQAKADALEAQEKAEAAKADAEAAKEAAETAQENSETAQAAAEAAQDAAEAAQTAAEAAQAKAEAEEAKAEAAQQAAESAQEAAEAAQKAAEDAETLAKAEQAAAEAAQKAAEAAQAAAAADKADAEAAKADAKVAKEEAEVAKAAAEAAKAAVDDAKAAVDATAEQAKADKEAAEAAQAKAEAAEALASAEQTAAEAAQKAAEAAQAAAAADKEAAEAAKAATAADKEAAEAAEAAAKTAKEAAEAAQAKAAQELADAQAAQAAAEQAQKAAEAAQAAAEEILAEIEARAAAKTMMRLYNEYSGEHFYTADRSEMNTLVAAGWTYEGDAWVAPAESSTPVYRLYNEYVPGGDHHYTTDKGEYDSLVAAGWHGEGIGWYSDDAEGIALIRLYNPYAYDSGKSGAHHYTADAGEAASLVTAGWNQEVVGAWYGMK